MYVQMFEDGSQEEVERLGSKRAGLAEMIRLGLPVPPGFTINTDACRDYLSCEVFSPQLEAEVAAALSVLEQRTGCRLGDPRSPLLVSVRSGAPHSMPGMLNTILNLGLTRASVEGLASRTDVVFAYGCYDRFLHMYAETVLGIDQSWLSSLEEPTAEYVIEQERTVRLQRLIEERAGIAIPEDPVKQLHRAIEGVFQSWNNPRAVRYRQHEGIPDMLGTAVNVQAMVFGNRDDRSGTGVVFTRDPSTGKPGLSGDFLQCAQGEQIVAGVSQTQGLEEMAASFPKAYAELCNCATMLEKNYHDMCDIEFTIEQNRLWILQTRVGKRSAAAALRIAVDLVNEGLIEPAEAVKRTKIASLHPSPGGTLDSCAHSLTKGLPASPGVAVGRLCLSPDEAEAAAANSIPVILVRRETSPNDIHGMIAAVGVLTSLGGLVSHAAVVARDMGKPAVVGASDIAIDFNARCIRVDGEEVQEGEVISICGSTGIIIRGEAPIVARGSDASLDRIER
jgi:pyruvate, orthophosphate dikinase